MHVVSWARPFVAVLFAIAVLVGATIGESGSWSVGRSAEAQVAGEVPGATKGSASDSEFWRQIRQGSQGMVTIPDKRAGVMIQSEGDNWRAFRNGPLSVFGGWALLGMIVLLALFFLLRGRIKVEHGLSGRLIERFNGIERFAHWLTAVSFIVLALTGLNILYGRYVLKPIIGGDAFAAISIAGKYMHNFIAFAFMLGVAMMFVLWVAHNIPNRHDLVWLLKGGGIFVKGVHPPSKKFNAGQKIIFWAVILGGLSLSLSGIALMFPFEFTMFAPTFEVLNQFGANLPTNLTAMQEMQLSQLWHAIVALVLIMIIIAHIYIGTIGMEGAFDAMGTGLVDENWAMEHHNLWVEEVRARAGAGGD